MQLLREKQNTAKRQKHIHKTRISCLTEQVSVVLHKAIKVDIKAKFAAVQLHLPRAFLLRVLKNPRQPSGNGNPSIIELPQQGRRAESVWSSPSK